MPKFDDCVDCMYYRSEFESEVCPECDAGELFEPLEEVPELDFDEDAA